MAKSNEIAIYSKSEDGHREAYISFIKSIFSAERVSGLKILVTKKPVCFLMIEECFALYITISLCRALLKRRTVGLIFRPIQAAEGKNARMLVKRNILIFLKYFNSIHTLSIFPTSLYPKISEIVSGYIYDFQLWDLSKEDREYISTLRAGVTQDLQGSLFEKVHQSAYKRKTVVAIGRQDRAKGFDEFVKLYKRQHLQNNNIFFVAAGKISDDLKPLVNIISDSSLIHNQRITDCEILQLYASANVVWCFYSQEYDQASGILGRAIQLGIPALVRDDSISQRLCQKEQIPHIAVSKIEDLNLNEIININRFEQKGMSIAQQFKEISLQNLSLAFGFCTNGGKIAD